MTNYNSTTEYTFTPPSELVEEWYAIADNNSEDVIQGIANRAAHWGADQELKACCEFIRDQFIMPENALDHAISELQDFRRPKPPSLKEQALKALENDSKDGVMIMIDMYQFKIIRDALNSLPD